MTWRTRKYNKVHVAHSGIKVHLKVSRGSVTASVPMRSFARFGLPRTRRSTSSRLVWGLADSQIGVRLNREGTASTSNRYVFGTPFASFRTRPAFPRSAVLRKRTNNPKNEPISLIKRD